MRGSAMSSDDMIARFRWRLAETVAWVLPRASLADPAHSLRTPAFVPPHVLEYGSLELRDYCYDPDAMCRIVETVADARAEALEAEGAYPGSPAHTLAGGRLLIAQPHHSVDDG